MFWIGFAIGVFVGPCVLLAVSLCMAAAQRERAEGARDD